MACDKLSPSDCLKRITNSRSRAGHTTREHEMPTNLPVPTKSTTSMNYESPPARNSSRKTPSRDRHEEHASNQGSKLPRPASVVRGNTPPEDDSMSGDSARGVSKAIDSPQRTTTMGGQNLERYPLSTRVQEITCTICKVLASICDGNKPCAGCLYSGRGRWCSYATVPQPVPTTRIIAPTPGSSPVYVDDGT
ncbi:uncharacterized protein RCC_03902 [Ramularia collo-cygni]|uniref:Zn(2)-C6 fungal-type domain-containing protein n=1 Tax=Ramularia collo-cygni TaxID=112498 RepID=A0A2D3V6B4_9PEZI|nr:uncharacterized protein RCC_03902 [Ramularia collo-cygni]CZT18064.1 uncharacterized protein RCC_03902 [Ramularia collo-cygni]